MERIVYPDIRKIACPYGIWSGRVELLVKSVDAGNVVLAYSFPFGLFSGTFRKVHGVHQPVHSSETDVNAIITLQYTADFIGPEGIVVIIVDPKDELSDFLILAGTGSRLRIKVLVVGAAIYLQHSAKSLDAVLVAQFVDCV